MNNMFYLSCVFLIFQVTGCKNYETLSRESYKVVEESEVIQVFLDGEVSSRNSEISGLSWYNDYLVLLPQYPDNYGSKFEGAFFKISKSKIDTFLQSQNKAPLKPVKVDVNFNGLDPDLLSIGSGFEAITFLGDDVYLTIECGEFFDTYAYILKGKVVGDLESIELYPDKMKKIESQTDISNLSDEAILRNGKEIITIYEANGANVNSEPYIHTFNTELNEISRGRLANIEYRITDATDPDSLGRFWIINYMWEEDGNDLLPDEDAEFIKYGVGKTHKNSKSIERLLEFEFLGNDLKRTKTPPIYLELDKNNKSRNWEGLVRYENGFLIITDKHPETILAYIKK
ncbi:MAG: hypothetical protein KKA84_04850 [Bacteroidetes bacterium]|nr:hypothetical protein [Bacteroidota bacterium]